MDRPDLKSLFDPHNRRPHSGALRGVLAVLLLVMTMGCVNMHKAARQTERDNTTNINFIRYQYCIENTNMWQVDGWFEIRSDGALSYWKGGPVRAVSVPRDAVEVLFREVSQDGVWDLPTVGGSGMSGPPRVMLTLQMGMQNLRYAPSNKMPGKLHQTLMSFVEKYTQWGQIKGVRP